MSYGNRYGGGGYDQPQGGYQRQPDHGEYGRPYGSQPRNNYNNYNGNDSMDGGYNAGPNVEMAPLAQNAGNMARGTPQGLLDECRSIDSGVEQIERNLEQLRMLQQRSLDDADSSGSSATSRQLDALSSETMAQYRTLTDRVRTVKSNPEAQKPMNKSHVGKVDRRLKAAIQQYQQVESQFRKRTQEQMARQYRIVRPDASEQEVRAAVEDPSGGQIFSQAMMQSDRRGQARAALSAVQDRHAALQKIEQQMTELAQLFQDMDTLVIQQEAAVENIEQKGEEVTEHMGQGLVHMDGAVTKAKAARKKKWICLGICVAIIVIIIIIVLIYVFVIRGTGGGNKNNDNNNNKRSVEDAVNALYSSGNLRRSLTAVNLDDEALQKLGRITKGRLHLPEMAHAQ